MEIIVQHSILYSSFSWSSLFTEAFPDITEMKEYVASGAGYLQGGLQRENWERGES